ncbi:MAG: ABC-F family ATP-binding cassette domain-containing protein [Deltaproteobacteria bacterium]|nr:ABC-F family ATP-binding cassette domain-containing protein [Deltaproteobacteria bacterium]MBN2674493.1 ABC-F family ATP-binding cassette domain-containing protein [Deltaproteobacteria bacterium]
MIHTTDVSLGFGGQTLFKEVNVKFTPGNCYGLIGANGSGKSTFLKLLSKELEPDSGEVHVAPKCRISQLKQDHFAYDEFSVLDTVMMGNARLFELIEEKDAIYAKENFSEEDGMVAAALEEEFNDMNGWEAESEAATLLAGLDISEADYSRKMAELTGPEKVKVLLARALFGNPDILLLDEPTNHLDIKAIMWLENFLFRFSNTVIVVSHDRHFLNKVCTHIADIDFGKITAYAGNYAFWRKSAELAKTLRENQKKKDEEKAKELKAFIQRFSANAAKSKQATSRQKQLEKLQLDDLPVSSRKYPFIEFKAEREAGKDILHVEGLSKTVDGVKLLDNVTFTINKGDKAVVLCKNSVAVKALFEILMGEQTPDSGTFKWGVTTSQTYFPSDNAAFFNDSALDILNWLRQFSHDEYESYLRGFLGKVLFTGDDVFKQTSVLSGGERVRCMLAKMMLSGANVLMLDEPTNHLDLESITAVNEGLIRYKGTVLFSTHDHQFIQTVANRIIDIDDLAASMNATSYDAYTGYE